MNIKIISPLLLFTLIINACGGGKNENTISEASTLNQQAPNQFNLPIYDGEWIANCEQTPDNFNWSFQESIEFTPDEIIAHTYWFDNENCNGSHVQHNEMVMIYSYLGEYTTPSGVIADLVEATYENFFVNGVLSNGDIIFSSIIGSSVFYPFHINGSSLYSFGGASNFTIDFDSFSLNGVVLDFNHPYVKQTSN